MTWSRSCTGKWSSAKQVSKVYSRNQIESNSSIFRFAKRFLLKNRFMYDSRPSRFVRLLSTGFRAPLHRWNVRSGRGIYREGLSESSESPKGHLKTMNPIGLIFVFFLSFSSLCQVSPVLESILKIQFLKSWFIFSRRIRNLNMLETIKLKWISDFPWTFWTL